MQYFLHSAGDMSVIEKLPRLLPEKTNCPIVIPTVGCNTSLKILLKMNEFRQEQSLCDIVLQCDDNRQFPAHRLVLSATSSYFAAMFHTNLAEKGQVLIKLKGIDSDSLDSLINYSYTTEIKVTVESVFSLLTAANMLCFGEVEKSCIQFLCDNLNMENCVDICTIAEMINCEELHRVSTMYVSQNFRQIVRGPNFANLTPLQLEMVLSNNMINISSEAEVYEAVMSWIKYDLSIRNKFLSSLLRHVRFTLMSRKYLVDRVLHENLIMQQEESRNIVLLALDHHLVPERLRSTSDVKVVPRQVTSRTLFVLGGELKNKARNSVEKYDIISESWSAAPSMLMPRKHVSAIVLDGYLYAIGGIHDQMDLISCEKYDPATEVWVPVASLKKCKGALSATVIDGWLYAFGGSNVKESLKAAEQYDPLSDTWNELPDMRLPRSHFGVSQLHGRIYAVGGYCGISEVEHCEYYEPFSGRWFEITGMSKSRMSHAVVSSQSRIYALGGKNSMGLVNSIEKYNPDLNMWLVIKSKVKLSLGMNLCVGFTPSYEHDTIFVVGGMTSDGEERNEVFHITLNSPDYSIRKGEPMLENRLFSGVALL